jgi:uncharacterized SAM-binding protein YcdF (DUF218 family)
MSFFFTSKLGWLLFQPVNFCLLLAFAGLVAQSVWPRTGRVVALAGVAALMVMNFSSVGKIILRPLEMRFPLPAADMPAPYGIIVLGGAIDDDLTRKHGEVDLLEGASRLTEAALLARRFPQAKIFYTGGSAVALGGESHEAEEARDLLVGLGVARERIDIETKSRNTDENARFSAAILKPQTGQVWLLVTSAFHMPRSMGLFRKAGFDVVAYPVDYRTYGDGRDYRAELFRVNELSLFDLATHEWAGLTAYYFAGKIDHWFPAP